MIPATTGIARYGLDTRGSAYLTAVLREGGTLSKAMADRMATRKGSVFALLPMGVPESRLADFKTGGLFERGANFPMPDGSRIEEVHSVVPRLSERLIGEELWLLSFESLGHPSDAGFAEDEQIRFFQDEVYSELRLSAVTAAEVAAEIHSSTGYANVSLVSKVGFESVPGEDRAIALGNATEIANSVELCLSVAYDFEGCVAWSPDSNRSETLVTRLLG